MLKGPAMRINFCTRFRERIAPDDYRMAEIKYWCLMFHNLKLTPLYRGSSLGNLSFRLKEDENSFIITASELKMKDNPTEDMFVTVHSFDTIKGIACASGVKNPSSESMLHYVIYSKRKDVGAIFHGHFTPLLLHGEELDIPVTLREEEPGSTALADSVLDILGNETFLIMKNHGFLSLGKDMKEAGEQAVKFCERCRTAESTLLTF